MTPASLKAQTLKDLVQMAKQRGVTGWHAMRKEQLVNALVKAAKSSATKSSVKAKVTAKTVAKPTSVKAKAAKPTPVKAAAAPSRRAPAVQSTSRTRKSAAVVVAKPVKTKAVKTTKAKAKVSQPLPRNSHVTERIEEARAKSDRTKNLAATVKSESKDRLVAMVRGPFWLHAYWELTSAGVARAQVALGQQWHSARPILRLVNILSSDASSSSERVVREINIHGGVNNWYIDVQEPPQSYRLEIGYLADGGRFYSLARSNVVTTPPATATDQMIDPHWNDVVENCDKIYAMSGGYSPDNSNTELQELFEERLRRPMGSPNGSRYGGGAELAMPKLRDFDFDIGAELIIFGTTRPSSHVTLQGEPVKLRPDGSFSVRLEMPNRRQVIPIVASSKDGGEQRTIVLAVERNTKIMEPVLRDSND